MLILIMLILILQIKLATIAMRLQHYRREAHRKKRMMIKGPFLGMFTPIMMS
jgi:hypothetical protein